MKTYYETSQLTEEALLALRERIRKEHWIWTCNGLVLPPDEDDFTFTHGDIIMLLFRAKRAPCYDIPVMG
jgi:hypothetical protein